MTANNPDEGDSSPSSHDSSNGNSTDSEVDDFTQFFVDDDDAEDSETASAAGPNGAEFGGSSGESDGSEGNVTTDGSVGATIGVEEDVEPESDDTASDSDETDSDDLDDENDAKGEEEVAESGDDSSSGLPDDLDTPDVPSETELRNLYRLTPGEHPKDWVRTQTMVTKYARKRACDYIDEYHDIIYVDEDADYGEEDNLEGTYLYNESTGLFEDDAKGDIKAIIEDLLPFASSGGEKTQILEKLQDRNKVEPGTLNARDRDDTYRCVDNGVLNISTWEFHDEHSPEYRMVTKLNAPWDPDVDTTEVRDFIEDIFPKKYVPTVIELLGDILTDHYKSQYFVMMYGPSNTGKTLFLEFVGRLLTKDNRSAQTLRDIATSRWSSAKLVSGVGVLANLADEVEGNRIEHPQNIKRAVGGREMSHENKGVDPFEVQNTAKLWNPTNDPPVIEDDRESIANRMIPIECPHTFVSDPDPENPFEKQKNPDILEELDTEEHRAALLQVMAEGLKRLRDRDWDVSLEDEEDSMERLERYHKEADTVYSFGSECLYETNAVNMYDDRTVFLTKQEVYNMYINYCESKGVSPIGKTVFFRKLNQGGSVDYGVMDAPGKTLPSGDRMPALIGVCPTELGWEFVARTNTVTRFVSEVMEGSDVPMPAEEEGDVESSGSQCSADDLFGNLPSNIAADGGRETFKIVVGVIGRLNEENSSEATELSVLNACDDEGVDTRETIDAIDALTEGGVVTQDTDGVYHVTEDIPTSNDSEDDDDNGGAITEAERKTVLREVRNAMSHEVDTVSLALLKGNLQRSDLSQARIDAVIDDLDAEGHVVVSSKGVTMVQSGAELISGGDE